MTLRPYQARALADVAAAHANGSRRVVVVAPPGAGKGTLAAHCLADAAAQGEHALLVVHRREIVLDLAARVRVIAADSVGVVLPGHDSEPHAPIQIASVQTLLARNQRPPADLLVTDEAHHYSAAEWGSILAAYPTARVVGFTATPERSDGQPLGDVFERLVVAAHYSDLLAAGHLVPCRVFRPPEVLGRDLAQEPLAAYQALAAGLRAFLFVSGVRYACDQASRFRAAGVAAEVVHAKTPKGERDQALRRFRAGELRVLVNHGVYTEGVDVPAAEAILLARACEHASLYLQITGRVLRPAPSKTHGLLVDLTGASLKHGLPTDDREYRLDGCAISEAGAPLCVCQKCGLTFEGAPPCPECGFMPAREAPAPPRIWSLELREVYAGPDTPDEAKGCEWARLRNLACEKGWSLGWAAREYRTLFSALPPLSWDERRLIYQQFTARGAARGYAPGWASHRYRDLFGVWPRFGRAA